MTSVADHVSEPILCPRWLHYWAVLTVCAAILALTSGAVVTTFRVGMADPVWPTYPWHLALISWSEPSSGFLIEHTHRLLDYFLGLCAILLAVGLWFGQPRRVLRWLGVAALAGIIAQGLLGGFRVLLHALVGTDLALIHGSFAQLVFALLVSLALFTSRGWAAGIVAPAAETNRLRHWSLLTAGLIFLQIIFGGLVRHTSSAFGQRAHLLIAFAVVAAVAWLAKGVYENHAADKPLTATVTLLAALVALQLLLGVEAWMTKFGTGVLPELQHLTVGQALIRTAHYLVGSGIFVTSVIIALRTRWRAGGVSPLMTPLDQGAYAPRSPKVSVPVGHMEGAA